MQSAYTRRECIPLEANLPVEHPEEPPELVHFHDSAMLVFTDFSRVVPVTTTTDRSIDDALQDMKNAGIRLLIVVNRKQHMIGLISADQIMGGEVFAPDFVHHVPARLQGIEVVRRRDHRAGYEGAGRYRISGDLAAPRGTGHALAYRGPTFNEFVLRTPGSATAIAEESAAQGVFAGVPTEDDTGLIVAVTERHRRQDIDRLAATLAGVGTSPAGRAA